MHPVIRMSAIAVMATALIFPSCKPCGANLDYLYQDLPFEMEKVAEPSIPSRRVSLTEFGGKGDGITMNTEAFAKAIENLENAGGGHLDVPAGVWLTGPIVLQSHIDLHVEKDAVILFDYNHDLYPLIDTNYEGLETKRCQSPISALSATDIAITGGGTIDGSGDWWRPVKKERVSKRFWANLVSSGGYLTEDGNVWLPSEAYARATEIFNHSAERHEYTDEQWEAMKDYLRPVMVSIRECERVLLEDCLFQNSPAWNLHPLMCKDVTVRNITVRNPAYANNGDGIDLESCKNSIIVGSTFDCGDDGICIKSGRDKQGRERGIPTENLIVDDCTVYHGHGGFVVGSEMSSGVKNIKVSNCRFLGTEVGLRFKSTRGRGGVVENIWIENINMTDIAMEPIIFNLFYTGAKAFEGYGKSAPAVPVDEGTPEFRNIFINNIKCSRCRNAMTFNGLPEKPIKGITVTNCDFSCLNGAEFNNAEDITLRDVRIIKTGGGPDIITYNVKNFDREMSVRMVRSEMARCPQATYLDFKEGELSWNYTPGLELKAFLDVYDAHGGEDILEYAKDFYDLNIEENGRVSRYAEGQGYSVDKVCPARTLFRLYDLTGAEKFRTAQDSIKVRLQGHPRTKEGALWHKSIYPYQIWLDGLYMACPFSAEYARRYLSGDEQKESFKDILNDFLIAAKHTYDPGTKLYRHAWDETHSMFWCNPETGQSQHCWGRGLGWYCMAMVEVLEMVPEGVEGRSELLKIFRDLMAELPNWTDPETGMWYQVLDQPGREGNYLESTCSAMFVYSMLRGARLGYLDKSMKEYAVKSYENFVKKFITEDENGLINITGCCSVGGLGGKQNRMGDFAYYLSEPVRDNDPKGVGPFIWASLEMEKL